MKNCKMKPFTVTAVLFFAGLLFSHTSFAQVATDTRAAHAEFDADEFDADRYQAYLNYRNHQIEISKQHLLKKSDKMAPHYQAGGASTANTSVLRSPSATSEISTIYASNNGGSPGGAVYFDITVGPSDISIKQININTAESGPFSMDVYTLLGTSIGNETNPAAWGAPASVGSGVGAGDDVPSTANLDVPIILSAHNTYGIALVLDASHSHEYTNGNGANQFYSNSDLSLALGSASNDPFSSPVFSPRVFNGSIVYEVVPPELAKCFCNDTIPYALSSVESYIFANPSPGAVRYEFLVVNDSLGVYDTIPGGFAPGVNPRYTSLVALPPSKLYYSATYSVSVRYQDSNNNWSAFGSACNVATPALPVPRVCGQYCGDTLPAENTPLSAVCEVPVIRRTAYRSAYQMEFRFVNLANNDTATTIGVGHPWGRPWIVSFARLDASFVQPNTTYSVDVRVRINGVWGVYGPDCLLTTPANTRRFDSSSPGEGSDIASDILRSGKKDNQVSMTVYPNPGKEGSNTLLTIENLNKAHSTVDVVVLDAYGKQVYHKNFKASGGRFGTSLQFDQRLAPGIYFIHVHAGEMQMSRKLILR